MSDRHLSEPALAPAGNIVPTPGSFSLRRLGAAALVLGLVQGLGGIVRDCALTCNVGYRQAPIAFLIVAGLSLPLVALQLRMQRSLGQELWRVYSTLFIAITLLTFRLVLGVLRPDSGATGLLSKLTYLGFFVWVDLAFMILGAQLFSLLQGDESSTDRGLTVFATAMYGGGLVGGIVASSINTWLVEHLHLPFDVARDHLMIAMAAVLLLLIPVGRSSAAAPAAPAAPAAGPEGSSLALTLRILTGDPHARLVSMAFAFAAASAICLESLFYWILSEQSTGGGGFVRLLATLAIWMNGVGLVLAAGGASRIIRHLGLGVVVLAVPACLLIGSGYLLLATALFVMLAMRVLKDSLSGGLYEPASERLLVRLHGAGYGKHRPVFDVASRLGTGLGALLVLMLTLLLHVPLRVLIAVVVVLHLAWLAALVPLARWARRPAAATLPAKL
jgi:hypothetical protein